MAVILPSNPREVQDFQFKLICRLRVFHGEDDEFRDCYSLVSCASKYGLAFVGVSNGIQVISLPCIEEREYASKTGEISDYLRNDIILPYRPTHVAVNSDQSLLAVVVSKDGCDHALIYIVTSFLSKTVRLQMEIRLSTSPGSHVLELRWNPGVPNTLASCMSDGSVGVYELKSSGFDIHTLPCDAQAMCLCWSPKGKQLVVGSQDGTLTQYKPDLKAVKSVTPPQIFAHLPGVVSVLWVSNFQFVAVYCDQEDTSERPAVVVVNAPKTGPVSYVNYEDITCSTGDLRKPQFYLIHMPHWNVILVGSSNSIEVGVLGLAENQTWEQWGLEDAARAELPLTAKQEETFPVGMSVDTSSQMEIPWGDNQTIPPMPVLLLLSHRGVLCLFRIINLGGSVPKVCSPPEKFAVEKCISLFTTAPSQTEGVNLPVQQPPAKPPSSTSGGEAPVDLNISAPQLQQGQQKQMCPVDDKQQQKDPLSFNEQQQKQALPANQQQKQLFPVHDQQQQKQPLSINQHQQQKPPLSVQQQQQKQPFSVNQQQQQKQLLSIQQQQQKQPLSINQQQQQKQPLSVNQQQQQQQQPLSVNQQQQQKQLLLIQQQQQQKHASQQAPSNSSDDTKMAFSSTAAASRTTKQAEKLPSQVLPAPKTLLAAKLQVSENAAISKLKQNEIPTSSEVHQEPTVTLPSSDLKQVEGNAYLAALMNEIFIFENEMVILRQQMKTSKVQAFTRQEMVLLRQKTNTMTEFCRDLSETTQAQAQEVSYLIAMTLEVFSWVENAKSRQKWHDFYLLPASRIPGLDPRSKHQRESIKCWVFYVDNQLKLVNNHLDLYWAEILDVFRESIRNKLNIPSMETVYEIMQLHIRTLLKLSGDLKVLKEKARKLKLSRRSSHLKTMKRMKKRPELIEQGKNAMKLAECFTRVSQSGERICTIPSSRELHRLLNSRKKAVILAKSKKFSAKKNVMLRKLLANHPIVKNVRNAQLPKITQRKKMPIEIPLTNVAQNSAGEVFGQITKGMFTKCGKVTDQVPWESNFKPSSMPPFNTTATVAKCIAEVKPQQPDSSNVISGTKPASNFFMASITSERSVPTTFSFSTHVQPSKISLLSKDPKTSSMQSPTFYVTPATTTTVVSQSTPSFPQFSSPKSSASVSNARVSFVDIFPPGSTTDVSTGVQELGKPSGNQVVPDNLRKTLFTPPVTSAGSLMQRTVAKSLFSGVQAEAALAEPSGAAKENDLSKNQEVNSAGSNFFRFGSLPPATLVRQIKTVSTEPSGIIKEKIPESNQVITSALTGFTFGSLSSAVSIPPASQVKAHPVEPSGLVKETVPSDNQKFGGSYKKNIVRALTSAATTPSSAELTSAATSVSDGVHSKSPSTKPLELVNEKSAPSNQEVGGNYNALAVSSAGSSVQTTVTTTIHGGVQTVASSNEPLGIAKEKPHASNQKTSASSVFNFASAVAPASQNEVTTTKPSEAAKTETPSSDLDKSPFSSDLNLGSLSSVATVSLAKETESVKVESSRTVKVETPSSNQEKSSALSSFNFGSFSSALTPINLSESPSADVSGMVKEITPSSNHEKSSSFNFGSFSSVLTSSTTAETAGSKTSSSKPFTFNFEALPSNLTVSTAPTQTLFSGASTSTTASNVTSSSSSVVTTIKPAASPFSTTPSNRITPTESPIVSMAVASTQPSTASTTTSSTTTTATTSTTATTTLPFSFTAATATSASAPTQSSAATAGAVLGSTTEATPSATSGSGLIKESIFGLAARTETTTAQSTFPASLTTSPSIFGAGNSAPVAFGAATTTTTATTAVSAPSVFGTTAALSAPSLFGSTNTSAPQSVDTQTNTMSVPSLFGSPSATTSAPSFGSTTEPTPAPSFFGSAATAMPTQSFFGSAATTSVPSLFGSTSTTTAATTPSVFGVSNTSSPFGNAGSGGGSGTSLFGSPTSGSSTTMFGSPSGGTSFFGQSATTSSGSSLFGQSTAATTAPASPFGQSSSFGQSRGVEFGGKPVFGQPASPIFGQSTGPGFGSSGGALFGSKLGGGDAFQPAAGGSVFGGGSQPNAPSGPFSGGVLGQSVSQTGFGSPSSFSSKPGGFGGSPVFGQTTPPGFGSPPSFGGKPGFGNSPTFSTPATGFGSLSPTQQSSTFENLANQNTMTFGNLAGSGGSSGFGSGEPQFGSTTQRSNQAPFAGSSFSSWR